MPKPSQPEIAQKALEIAFQTRQHPLQESLARGEAMLEVCRRAKDWHALNTYETRCKLSRAVAHLLTVEDQTP